MVIGPSFYNQGDQKLYQDYQYLPQEQYRLGLNLPKTEQATDSINTTFGLPATNAFTNSGSNNYFAGSPNNLIQDYNTITKDRYFRNQDTPLVDGLYQSKLDKTFMGMPSYRQQELTGPDLGEYIGTNTDVPLEQTMAGRVQNNLGRIKDTTSGIMGNIKGFGPVSMALNAMDKFSSLPTANQEFIKMNMGYTGPTVFGENNSGLSKDPYGKNTRSLLGDYGAYVDKTAAGYEDITDEEFEKLSDFQKQKISFYRAKQKELNEIKQKEITEQKQQAQDFMNKNPNYGNNYDPTKDHSGDGGYGNTSGDSYGNKGGTRSAHNRSSDLGFSDIRLKENVEFIGKSPSNINIYSFNYLNNPTKYQGVMAHEVPWASKKHNSGYLMVDYNKVDVKFKKI